jgi:hypothetical protein
MNMVSPDAVREAYESAKLAVAVIEDTDYRRIAFEVVFTQNLNANQVHAPVPVNREPMQTRDLTLGLSAQRSSLGEFLASVNVSSFVDRVIAIAYYHLHGLQQEAVTRQEFLVAFKKARFTPPKNISDVIAQCIRKGLLMDAFEPKDGQKAWSVTQTGERFIEDRLKSE